MPPAFFLVDATVLELHPLPHVCCVAVQRSDRCVHVFDPLSLPDTLAFCQLFSSRWHIFRTPRPLFSHPPQPLTVYYSIARAAAFFLTTECPCVPCMPGLAVRLSIDNAQRIFWVLNIPLGRLSPFRGLDVLKHLHGLLLTAFGCNMSESQMS